MTERTSLTAARRAPRRAGWLVPTALLLVSVIPVAAGAMRLSDLTGGEVTPDSARFFASPIPVVVHILTVTVFCVLGTFQFVPSLRRGSPSWHRIAGRILAPAGILAALSGMWMSVFYSLPAEHGPALLALRLIFGSAMVASIVLAVFAIRRRDIPTHSAWMTRAYAIALGAGSQSIIIIPFMLAFGAVTELSFAVLMGAGWVINLAIAEYVIRRRASRAIGRTAGVSGSTPVAARIMRG